MSWGSAGFPSPRMRRTSRPLSMISESPDDLSSPSVSNDGKVKVKGQATTVNVKVQGDHNDTIGSLTPPSTNKSSGVPTRRKAVAPLQHPVTVLLETSTTTHSDSINSNDQSPPSSCDPDDVDHKKVNIPEITPTVSSIIKRFSSMSNANNARDNNNTLRNQRSPKVSPPSPHHNSTTESSTTTSSRLPTPISDNDSGIVLDIVHSPEVLDRNHNKLSWKSANKYHEENSRTKHSEVINASTANTTKCNELIHENGSDSCSQFDSTINEDDSRIIQMDSNRSDSAMVYANCDASVNCEYSCRENTHQTFNFPKEDLCDALNNNSNNNIHTTTNNNNNDNDGIISPIDSIQNEPQTTHNLSNTSKDSSTSCKEYHHPSEDITSSVFHHPSNDPQSPNTHAIRVLTSTPKFKTTATVTLSTQNRNPLQKQLHLQSIKTAIPNIQNITSLSSKYCISKPNTSIQTLKHNYGGIVLQTSVTKKANTQTESPSKSDGKQTDSSSTLDGETMEWKRRVKRSVSLIKAPSVSENSGPRRRTSSIQSSNHNTDLTSCNEQTRPHNHTEENKNSSHAFVSNNNSKHQINEDAGVNNDQSNNYNNSNHTGPIRRISAIDQSNFSLLKVATSRLNLPTRRPSVTAWKEKYLKGNGSEGGSFNSSFCDGSVGDKKNGCGGDMKVVSCEEADTLDNKTIGTRGDWGITEDVKNRINGSLAWLRQELIDIRILDQSLARQFLDLREAMNDFRLAVECEDHQELIEDAEEDMEEIRELSQLVDIPPEMLSHLSPLKHVGITRMNISSRRFSTC